MPHTDKTHVDHKIKVNKLQNKKKCVRRNHLLQLMH